MHATHTPRATAHHDAYHPGWLSASAIFRRHPRATDAPCGRDGAERSEDINAIDWANRLPKSKPLLKSTRLVLCTSTKMSATAWDSAPTLARRSGGAGLGAGLGGFGVLRLCAGGRQRLLEAVT